MTLTTHAIVGGAMTVIIPVPAAAIVFAFCSHFVLDALPHRDYRLRSAEKHPENPLLSDMHGGADFYYDLWHTALDAILGVSLAVLFFSFIFFHAPPTLVFFAACTGVLPDFLQFVYFKTRASVLRPLQQFHVWVQKGRELDIEPPVGISIQAIGLIVFVGVLSVALR